MCIRDRYCREWGTRYPVGRDKFVSYIRKHKLYVRIPRRYKAPRTTDSTHDLPTYPNLVRKLIPDQPNQVWSSDITYIPLERGDKMCIRDRPYAFLRADAL